MNIRIVKIVVSFEGLSRLNQCRNAASETIGLRIAFAELGRQHVRQFDLADLGLDLMVRHLGVEIMLKSLFAEQCNEEFLRQVCVCVELPLFDQETSQFRGSDQWMRGYNAMQFHPDLVDIRRLQAVVPLAYFDLLV